jgi:cyclopropane-fatty-acyl-phospholipid synthase
VTAAAGRRLRPARVTSIDLAARRLVLRALGHLRAGELVLLEGSRRHRFGAAGEGGLRATVAVHSPRFYRGLLGGSLGAARSYIDGDWDCDDLVSLTRIVSLNMGAIDRWSGRTAPLVDPARRAIRWFGRNTRRRSRDNVSRHYDLGNELFALMLDDTMAYSCALFESPDASLREASLAKFEHVSRKLDLGPGDEVLEIGGGWGGFAIHAATRRGCRVTTTTVSREQHRLATERVRAAGLSDRVTVLLSDYRDLRGRFDKLVSIEMIEAVGWQYFDTFFARCSRLLRPDGAMLLQAITIAHPLYLTGRSSAGFTNAMIFPGGCLPSVEAMLRSTARVTDMRLVQLEDITPHYPKTLRSWRENLVARREAVMKLGFDERFWRTWMLYLSYCEGAFRERRITDMQLLFAKPGFRDERRLVRSPGDRQSEPAPEPDRIAAGAASG